MPIHRPAACRNSIILKWNLGASGRYWSKFDKTGYSFKKLHFDSDFFLNQLFCVLGIKTVLVTFKPQITGLLLVLQPFFFLPEIKQLLIDIISFYDHSFRLLKRSIGVINGWVGGLNRDWKSNGKLEWGRKVDLR